MRLKEIQAKSILRKTRKIDSWFLSWYGMNLYRGCSHNCNYCDGRAEKYNVCRAKEAGVSFVIFGGMTLKNGRQKDFFLDIIENYNPGILKDYQEIYPPGNKWGQPTDRYSCTVNRRFRDIIRKYPLPVRVPLELLSGILSKNDLVTDDPHIIF